MEKELPIGWTETKLDTIVFQKKGKKPLKLEPAEFKNSVPYLDIHALEKGIYRQYADINSSNIMDEDMIAIVWDGARSGWVSKGKYGAIGSTLAALKPIKVDINYVFYFLQCNFSLINTNPRGIGIPHVDPTLLWNLSVPLPPLPEQQRIVAKLDTLFGQLDKIKTHLEHIPQLLKDFRQKVLTQAVTGKLTEEWREGKILTGIELKKDKYEVEFEFLETSDFPETWKYVALGNYAECSRGKFTARPRNDPQFFEGEYPFMQIGDLPGNGGLFYSYSSTLNEKGKSVSKCFPKGTVVIAIVGATIGNTGILEKEVFFPDSLIGINSENPFSNFYIEYFLRFIKYKIRELSYAGGGQPNIKMPNITNLGIAIPPIEEQQEIVRCVESLFAKADKIEASYQKLKEKTEQLPQAILAKAFRGELVEQLPTDGDARDLLEEIKKAKGTIGGKGKKNKQG